jgi:hypothetical protein
LASEINMAAFRALINTLEGPTHVKEGLIAMIKSLPLIQNVPANHDQAYLANIPKLPPMESMILGKLMAANGEAVEIGTSSSIYNRISRLKKVLAQSRKDWKIIRKSKGWYYLEKPKND